MPRGVYVRSSETLAKLDQARSKHQFERKEKAYSRHVCEYCAANFEARTKLGRRFCSNSCKTKAQLSDPTNHPNWRGEDGNTTAIHRWIDKVRGGRPDRCERCNYQPSRAIDGRAKIHWANLSGKYKREISDWAALCIPCHWRHDNQIKKLQDWRAANRYLERNI